MRIGSLEFADLITGGEGGPKGRLLCVFRAGSPPSQFGRDFFHGFLYRESHRKGTKSLCLTTVKQTNVFFTLPVLDFHITLEARNPARRCLRQYRVEAGTDLFGVWVVEISYGRIGAAGR